MWRIGVIMFCLAGCGDGGGGGADLTGRLAAFDDLMADVTAAGVTPVNQLPTGGVVNYAGDMRLQLPLGPDAAVVPYLGRLQARISFDDLQPPVVGTVSDFAGPQGALTGQLDILDGVLDRGADPSADYMLRARLTGQLSDGAAAYDLNGEIAGDFYGRTADAVAGVVFGTISDGAALDRFDGAFAAVRP